MRKNFNALMERTKRFFEADSSSGGALIMINNIKSIRMPASAPLNQWVFPTDLKKYMDVQIERLVCFWENRCDIDDDLIPSLHPRFGLAEFTAFLGGEVVFSEDTSWHQTLLNEWADLDALELREDTPWMRMMTEAYHYLAEKSAGRFLLRLRGAMGPMDMANIIRGNRFFTDLYDSPEAVYKLLNFCSNAAGWFLDRQQKLIGRLNGGVMTGFGLWLPGCSAGHISEDASTMCSPAAYRKFGVPYTTQLTQRYDHVLVHTHSVGKHCLADIAGIPKVDVIEICNDPNCPTGMDIYKEMGNHCLYGKTIIVNPTYEEIVQNLTFLKERKSILFYDASDITDAERTIDLVRRELNGSNY